ncbi:hypothetical protein LOD99_12858 [Oopsacas minuta]|uniref:Nuclear cap-binding protein subunit 3 n=1 Tax=Oopsacas minuta TaxID=111878 RepID=A0AAV7JD66_9METZ|nr:hypothetical protein LOD99_12858 [Oopsacas minuta]
MSDTSEKLDSIPSSPPSPGELPTQREESPKQFGPCPPPVIVTGVHTDDVIDPLRKDTNHTTGDSLSDPPSSPVPHPTSPPSHPRGTETSPLVSPGPNNSQPSNTNKDIPYFSDRLCPEGEEIEFDRFDHPRIRLDTLHMKGTDDMSNTDLCQYFLAFGKVSLEWVNDTSCNIRFQDKTTATQALFSVGYKPLESTIPIQPAREDKADSGVSSNESEVMVEVNPWRVALPHFKNVNLKLRYATTADRKQPGAATRSRYYMKYGNPHRGDLHPDHLLSIDSKDRKRQVKKRLGAQINVRNIEMDQNLEGYIADIESSQQAPSKFLKLYTDHRGQDRDSSDDSDDNFICVAKSSVDLRTKLNAKSKF